jgi:uncharacterized YigZ family protein
MKSYITLGTAAEDRFTEKKSVFIGNAARVETEEQAIEFVKKIKAKYPDARHNVYAYILRENNISRFTDDGEPHGTAGIPVINVLRGRNLVDCAVVVTRYFGGILLGTGGLVRAYTEGAILAVNAAGLVEMSPCALIKTESDYTDYQKIRYTVTKMGGEEKDTVYGMGVTAYFNISFELAQQACVSVSEQTSARATAEIVGTSYKEIIK